jgi:hypothetical protein
VWNSGDFEQLRAGKPISPGPVKQIPVLKKQLTSKILP